MNSEEVANGNGATEAIVREPQKKNYRVECQSSKKGQSVSLKSKLARLKRVIDRDGLLTCNERMKLAKNICPMILGIQKFWEGKFEGPNDF